MTNHYDSMRHGRTCFVWMNKYGRFLTAAQLLFFSFSLLIFVPVFSFEPRVFTGQLFFVLLNNFFLEIRLDGAL